MTSLNLPPEIRGALEDGAALIVSVSGGKDSDAMALALARARHEYHWPGEMVLVHCDLGRMEWRYSLPHCRALADHVHAELIVLHHHEHDLLDGIWARMAKRPDAPPWPSAAARYCTAGWKRGVVDKWVRNTYPENAEVVVAMGIRAEESSARACKPVCRPRVKASAPTKGRYVHDWLPIHSWTLAEVWNEIGYTLDELHEIQATTRLTGVVPGDFKAHPAYAWGNERVSCALCVLASQNDLQNGAEHNPELYRQLCDIEIESGYSFQERLWLGSLCPDCLTAEQSGWYQARGVGHEIAQLALF